MLQKTYFQLNNLSGKEKQQAKKDYMYWDKQL